MKRPVYIYNHISVIKLDHLLTFSGLIYSEVSSKLYRDCICQLGSIIRGGDA